MTLQEIFDKAAVHLLTQMKLSIGNMHGVNSCLYRQDYTAECTCQCGAGPFIPNDKYNKDMENTLFSEINKKYNLGYSPRQVSLICDIQNIHDNDSPENWHKLLKDITNKYKLNTDVLNKFSPVPVE